LRRPDINRQLMVAGPVWRALRFVLSSVCCVNVYWKGAFNKRRLCICVCGSLGRFRSSLRQIDFSSFPFLVVD